MGHVVNPVCFTLKQEIQEIPFSMLVLPIVLLQKVCILTVSVIA